MRAENGPLAGFAFAVVARVFERPPLGSAGAEVLAAQTVSHAVGDP